MTASTERPQQAPRLGLRRDGIEPDPEVTAMRERDGICPVSTLVGHQAQLVASYRDARSVHSDPALGLSTVPAPPGIADADIALRRPGNLLSLDAPDHARLRRMLTGRFTQRAMRALEPRVEAIVHDTLDHMVTGGPPADLVAGFALPVPSLVICELLGVPYADRAEFSERAERTLDSSLTPEQRVAVSAASYDYMATLVGRARRDPQDDLLGMLIHEHGDHGAADGGFDDRELINLANLLLVAGHETTSNVIALGVLAVLTDADQLAVLRAAVEAPEPGPLAAAVEELLRYISPVSAGFPRMANEDVSVGTHTVPAGTMVTASLCAANRDPALAPHLDAGDLDHLDLARHPLPHVAFGHGVHHCLGAPLARMELRAAFSALLRRLPALSLAVAPEELRFRRESLIHGVEELPVTW